METHDIETHNDDKPVGRILTRREVLALLGGSGALMLVGGRLVTSGGKTLAQAATATGTAQATSAATSAATGTLTGTAFPSCIVKPELTEGPYFVDGQLERVDIRVEPSDNTVREGKQVRILYVVSSVTATACIPLEGVQVDLWHCDALGDYSSVEDPGTGSTLADKSWLRGYQITDKEGKAEFITIYPGWYSGRAVHMHFKLRTEPDAENGYEFTSQFFFPEELTDVVHAEAPYKSNGTRDTLNSTDNIYQGGGDQLVLDLVEDGDGYTVTFTIGLDLTDTSGDSDSADNSEGNVPGNPPQGTPPNGGPGSGSPPPRGTRPAGGPPGQGGTVTPTRTP